QDWAVHTLETSLDEAKAMGAMALFGENYGDQVRVVEIGGPFSMELCGGIHVDHSSQIGPVAVLGESSIGSGARRIEAYSGLDSFAYLSRERALAAGLATALKSPSEELPDRIAALTEKLKEAEKEIAALHRQQLLAQAGSYLANAQDVNGLKVVTAKLPDGTSANDLRTIAIDLKGRLGDQSGVIVLGARDEKNKAPFVVGATKAAIQRGVKSGQLVGVIAGYVAGRGGGKPDMAQGSGNDASGFDSGFAAVVNELKNL
ncbi:MAG: DHHA1 domain-containing protein, partial [Corynebacterium sp.]|nr:DHHA1 domain-containing protein [Corynebacterium sp.]